VTCLQGANAHHVRGHLVASALAGSWRGEPPATLHPDALAEVAEILVQSGAAPLVWWRLRHAHVPTSSSLAQLRDAYYWHSVESRLHERDIRAAIAALASAGIEPLLAKGWAVARLYPAPGLRPYSDVDLCVRPADKVGAEAALASVAPGITPVDLHTRIVDMPDRSFDALRERSSIESLGDIPVRILGIEDHLRFLCLHLLRHGARRPLWLCDVGVVLDGLPNDFDWRRFLSGESRRTAWAVGVLVLANRLLGAPLDAVPPVVRHAAVPDWLVSTIVCQWGEDFRPTSTRLMGAALSRLDWFLLGLRERWPNPIEATYGLDGYLTTRVRLRYQIQAYAERSISFAAGRPHGAH